VTRRRNVYGPVPSRRFGLSLGIDPLEPKTCCYDCVYCQQGRTTTLSTTREDLVPVTDVLADVREALARCTPDVLTLAGSGEPTLYLSMGELIDGLHEMCEAPVVVLTNGALMGDPQVRSEASRAEIISPSLDAGDAETFRRINRPHPDVDFDAMVEGLRALRQEASGRYLLEVLVARGVNDAPVHLERLAALARSIEPDAILVNTPVRPTPGRRQLALDGEQMQRIAAMFGPSAEVIAARETAHARPSTALPRDVLAVLERRPCTASELAASMGIDPGDLARTLQELGRAEAIEQTVDGHWCISGNGREKG